MTNRIKLSASLRGSLGEDKDWWELVVDDKGKMYVEHEWSHRNAYEFRVGNSGKKQITVSHFLSGDYDSKAQDKVHKELERRKGAA